MKINLVNKVQNDLLETRALVSLFSILFCQVGSQLVPGIFALEVREGERRTESAGRCGKPLCCLASILEAAPLPTIYLVPLEKVQPPGR